MVLFLIFRVQYWHPKHVFCDYDLMIVDDFIVYT